MAKGSEQLKIWEDKWIDTLCGGCYCTCAIRVHRINGIPVAIDGVPESALGAMGGLCGKGVAMLMTLYDPNRLNVPLRRTNPEKGIGVDPKWKEITWEEALSEIAERMEKIRADDPNKFWFFFTTSQGTEWAVDALMWLGAFGSRVSGVSGGSIHCGNAAHQIAGLCHAAWSVCPDWKYTNYVIYWGSSKGTAAGHSMTINARLAAEARARGVKIVCFDPMCNFAGGKADEWIPILPGTDGAVAQAIANVLLNELGVYYVRYL